MNDAPIQLAPQESKARAVLEEMLAEADDLVEVVVLARRKDRRETFLMTNMQMDILASLSARLQSEVVALYLDID